MTDRFQCTTSLLTSPILFIGSTVHATSLLNYPTASPLISPTLFKEYILHLLSILLYQPSHLTFTPAVLSPSLFISATAYLLSPITCTIYPIYVSSRYCPVPIVPSTVYLSTTGHMSEFLTTVLFWSTKNPCVVILKCKCYAAYADRFYGCGFSKFSNTLMRVVGRFNLLFLPPLTASIN